MIAVAVPAEAAPSARVAASDGILVLAQQKCRREPIWGFRISAFCKPTGICPDRVIKGYRTVCS
jgi:hypothetical protein